jgi:hypothetical protein
MMGLPKVGTWIGLPVAARAGRERVSRWAVSEEAALSLANSGIIGTSASMAKAAGPAGR